MNWEYVQEGTGNFLRILSDDRETFADEMFSYQDIQGFLPLEIRCINGKKEAFYDITGKIFQQQNNRAPQPYQRGNVIRYKTNSRIAKTAIDLSNYKCSVI